MSANTLLNLSGEIVSIGDLPEQDAPRIVGVPHIMIRRSDGSAVLISGLTQDECRACASAFMDSVSVSIRGAT